jgi:hypothetical protein
MATETATRGSTERIDWQLGVVGGILGATAMALLVTAMNPPTLAAAIPALYGLSGGVAGWVVHLSHGAVLGVVFVAGVRALDVDGVGPTVGAGVAWGVLTWAGLAALLMPVWLSAVGFPGAPPFPNFAPPSLLWHVVYGLVLGGAFAALD